MLITEKRIRRGVFKSVPALEQAITEYLAEHNADPKPFAWTADADSILDRIKTVCQRTSDSEHYTCLTRAGVGGRGALQELA